MPCRPGANRPPGSPARGPDEDSWHGSPVPAGHLAEVVEELGRLDHLEVMSVEARLASVGPPRPSAWFRSARPRPGIFYGLPPPDCWISGQIELTAWLPSGLKGGVRPTRSILWRLRRSFGCLGALYAPKQTLDVRDSPRVFPLAAEETALSLARALAGRRRSRGALRAPPPGRCGEGAGPPAGAGPG